MTTPEEKLVNGEQTTSKAWLEGAIISQEALMQEYESKPDSEEYKAALAAYQALKKEQRADDELMIKAYKNRAEIEACRRQGKFDLKKWGFDLLGNFVLGAGFTGMEAFGYMIPSKLANGISSIKRVKDKD